MAYHNVWDSTDQIPDRAIGGQTDPAGAPAPPAIDLVSRWGEIDPTDGGKTGRYSLDADWHLVDGHSSLHATAYGLYYNLALFSNFTYFLDDPIHGDQIGPERQPVRVRRPGDRIPGATLCWAMIQKLLSALKSV